MTQRPDFDVERFIRDCGGPVQVSFFCNVARSTPYNWMRRKNMHLDHLAALKLRFPHLDLNSYVRLTDE